MSEVGGLGFLNWVVVVVDDFVKVLSYSFGHVVKLLVVILKCIFFDESIESD
jgi:hypothetical protein